VTFFQYAQIVTVVTMIAAGQLLFQKSASDSPPLSTLAGMTSLMTNPVFILALVIYGVATLLWVAVLQQVPLSRAYPFNALSFILVPLAAIVFFGEAASVRLFIGLTLVVIGLIVVGGRG
jgi:undecaprenyl phosphate-alpha-L-ara4N flippase subunit ArnE